MPLRESVSVVKRRLQMKENMEKPYYGFGIVLEVGFPC